MENLVISNNFETVKSSDLEKVAKKKAKVEGKSIRAAIREFQKNFSSPEMLELEIRYAGKVSKFGITPNMVLSTQKYQVFSGEVFLYACKKVKGVLVPKTDWTMNDIFIAWKKLNVGGYKSEIIKTQFCSNELTIEEIEIAKDTHIMNEEKARNKMIKALNKPKEEKKPRHRNSKKSESVNESAPAVESVNVVSDCQSSQNQPIEVVGKTISSSIVETQLSIF